MNNLDQNTKVLHGEHQLKCFGNFLNEYNKKLRTFLKQNELNTNCSDGCNGFIAIKPLFPILIDYIKHYESTTIFELIESENKILNKVLITFIQLCEEINILNKDIKNNQIKFISLDESIKESECHDNIYIKISKSMKFLYHIQYLLNDSNKLLVILIQQLCASIDNPERLLRLHLTLEFKDVLDCFCDGMVQLIIFEQILKNSNLCETWPTYSSIINRVSKSIEHFNNYDENELNGLEEFLNCIKTLFTDDCFQTFLDSIINIKNDINTNTLMKLDNFFQKYVQNNLEIIECISNDTNEIYDTEILIKTNAMVVVCFYLIGNFDQKQLKSLIEYNNKFSGIPIGGNYIFCADIFLQKYASSFIKQHQKLLATSHQLRQAYLQAKVQNLPKEIKVYGINVTQWSLQIKSMLKSDIYCLKTDDFKNIAELFLKGIQLASSISHTIKQIPNLHILYDIPMHKSTLLSIYKLIEYLQFILLTFQQNSYKISQFYYCIFGYLQHKLIYFIGIAKKNISKSNFNEKNLDVLSTLQIAEKCISGPASNLRISAASLALSANNPTRILGKDLIRNLNKAIYSLKLFMNLKENLEKNDNMLFMYRQLSVLPIYLKNFGKNADNFSIQYVLSAVNECIEFCKINNFDNNCIQDLQNSYYNSLKCEIINKLCADVETFLRIEVHNKLQQESADVFNQMNSNDFRLINFPPFAIADSFIIMKGYIEKYLSNMFYNLTTISLYDWRTYGEMRHLAQNKFALSTIDDNLPTQTLEQGIDVLEIMRNIHTFVGQYVYNMNNQIFLEQNSNNKHLNTIGIKHVANSLRTHGTGIINTTVNFTYQFLRKKLYTFSQFMYDEHIKSRLIKDLKYFRDNKEKSNHMYSFEKAEAFNKNVKKLGLSPEGLSYLDLFRQLITQIGNAMGYIRLICSGGINCGFNTSVYLPKFENQLKFADKCRENNLSNITIEAAESLEINMNNVTGNFLEAGEYFHLLIDAFSHTFRDDKNLHLRTFYLIVPPLTINFVEYIINAKDKINKKDKNGALFVDDGFAIGLAYTLKLLNQVTEFNSLHWFDSIKEKYNDLRNEVTKQRTSLTTTSIDSNLQQALTLTERRINNHQLEFDLLFYNLFSSKIFFQ